MKNLGGDPSSSLSPALLKLSQANQKLLKGLADYKGLSFCLLDDNREGLSKAEENLKTYMRQQAAFLVSKLGGEWRFSHENASFIIVNLTNSKDKGQIDQLLAKYPELKQEIKNSLLNLKNSHSINDPKH
jgi:hypothetical protein